MEKVVVKKFRKVAIANRGEVAVRIICACHEMGIQTVLLHSEADIGTKAFRMSDEAVCIGAAATSESYLNIERNVAAAKAAGADAVHPGFGFLSENSVFAQACHEAGLVFIGPSASAIAKMGDKVSARKIMEAAGVPVVPGYQGEDVSIQKLRQEAERIGIPLMIKAAAGGGGRGLRVVESFDQFEPLVLSAQREALAAFGSDRVFLEKYIVDAKHIEFQVFGDQFGNYIHLFDRECSVQRRHQKIIEEAVSPSLTDELRRKMGEASVRAAQAVSYTAAGTVEFLLKGEEFYFMEMNTRLQVEHPVTEEVLGVDLVKAQLIVSQGGRLPWAQDDLRPRGHSIECRVYAEDPYQNGIPSTGPLGTLHWPEGPGRRFEVGFEVGDEITSYYDPMVAKVIVWDETRSRCIAKALRVLDETVIFGVRTNIPLLKEILDHHEFRTGEMTTGFFAKNFSEGLTKQDLTPEILQIVASLRNQVGPVGAMAELDPATTTSTSASSPWQNPWRLP